jgi:hypothetical protein
MISAADGVCKRHSAILDWFYAAIDNLMIAQ